MTKLYAIIVAAAFGTSACFALAPGHHDTKHHPMVHKNMVVHHRHHHHHPSKHMIMVGKRPANHVVVMKHHPMAKHHPVAKSVKMVKVHPHSH
ncbi:MAG TPA: hypothetical protein VMI31_06745 [Fimbriimonadaceae bacterium]|nr:hypothetical protein [Fimbriimonadaceae bacterium]